MKILAVVAIAILAFAAGVWTAPLVAVAADRTPEGHALKCLAKGRICVGMMAEKVFLSGVEDNIGGLIGLYCGFDAPGVGAKVDMNLADLIAHGCSGTRYVGQFSDGRHLTSVWVEGGKIVQLDRLPRHTLDF